MAGHSHSANIAVRKGKQDRLRARIFSKLSKNIMIAARTGPDPDSNFTLRHAIDMARAQSMPKDKIEHAVKKGAGLLEGAQVTEVTYEAIGPGGGGVAMLIDVVSDNMNRTRPEICSLVDKSGGKMAANNAVKWTFQRKGFLAVPKAAISEEKLMDLVLGAGAEDLATQDEHYEILTPTDALDAVRKALADAKITPTEAEVRFIAENQVDVEADQARKVLKMIDHIGEHDDVNGIHHNMKISPEVRAVMKELAEKDE